jgi:hypothetical protein
MARRVWHRALSIWLLISLSSPVLSIFLLASGSGDNTVKLWDLATGAGLRTLTGHIGSVDAVAFSPDGKQLASGSSDDTVKLWDPATGAGLRTLAGHNSSVAAVAYSPNGKQLASASWDGDDTVKLWDLGTGAVLQTLRGHNGGVWAVAYSPSQTTLPTSATTTSAKPTSTTLIPTLQRDTALSTGAKVGIGVGVGVIALGVGLLLLRRIRRRARGVAPVESSHERFEKAELPHSDLPRTHGRAELGGEPISELEGSPAEGRNPFHKAEGFFEKESQPNDEDEIVTDSAKHFHDTAGPPCGSTTTQLDSVCSTVR